jgi:hypothetical protein
MGASELAPIDPVLLEPIVWLDGEILKAVRQVRIEIELEPTDDSPLEISKRWPDLPLIMLAEEILFCTTFYLCQESG